MAGARSSSARRSRASDGRRYQQELGIDDPQARTGYSFQIERRYVPVNRRQAAAFQAMLDRLQSLNLIAWSRSLTTIRVVVASDASNVTVKGP